MKKIKTYQNQRILVVGLATSGLNAALLLSRLGAQVSVTEQQDVSADVTQALKAAHVQLLNEPQTPALLDGGYDLLVKNPGIPYDTPLIAAALERQIPIIGEVELASEVSDAPIVAVTGSNGKTTTTTLIQKMLNQERPAGQAYYAGNIGISAAEVAQKVTAKDTLVMEVSSFMLLETTRFHPHIAVLTNIFSNHLDYHKTRDNYVAAKMRITQNQTANDFFVVNYDNPEWRDLAQQSAAQVVPFSRTQVVANGAYEQAGHLYWRGEYVMDAGSIKIPGEHNVENALAALAVAKLAGKSNAAIQHVLETFGGVRHRTQFVLEAAGRQYYNDSKATDIEATEMALKGFKAPVVLLAGGLDRGYTFEKLVPALRAHVKALVLFGETAPLLAQAAAAAGITTVKKTETVVTAVPLAYQLSDPGDIILLSPANASWDQYPNFEVRGDEFIHAVEQLTGKQEEQ